MARSFIDQLNGLGVVGEDRAQIHEDLARTSGWYPSVPEAGDVAVMAYANGVRPGEDLRRVLGLVADLTAVTGESVEACGSVLNRVAASGRCQGDTLVHLASMGIPTAQLLAGHLGVEAEAVREKASAGQITFDDLLAALEKGVGGASRTAA